MNGTIVSRECARLCERSLADVAREGPQVDMAPVVHDQACALDEDAIAPWMFTNKMSHKAPELGPDHFHLLI